MKNVKRWLALATAGCALMSGSALAQETAYTPGTYTAISEGRNGPIVIQMDFSEDAITDVRVITHNETYNVGDAPLEQYPAQIVDNQTVNLDIVSGATITSNALKEAVKAALAQAK